MNQAGRNYAQQLASKTYSPMEYRRKLVRTQNMSCLCHCSGEIDLSTLLYFSVNDMQIGKGPFVLLLFSEISQNSPDQLEGRDVFGRMYTYAIIEDVATEVFTGHHAFYSSELDGRLVLLINFPFGIFPDPSLADFLDESCLEVIRLCRERYDMNVVSYICPPLENINYASAVYSKLLELATIHRYCELQPEPPVVHPPQAEPNLWMDFSTNVQEYAMNLLGAIVNNQDYHALADEILQTLVDSHPLNIQILKQLLVLFIECLYSSAQNLGIKIKPKEQRRDDFCVIFDSLHLRQARECLHKILDELKQEHGQISRRTALRQLDAALQYITENLSNPDLTLESCAAFIGCSTSALNKVFRRQLNTSVAKYIREIRLEKAFNMLLEGSSVSTTSAQCGFGSTETFHRLFKERYGITPGQLRAGNEAGKHLS